ncbi:MAG: YdcF family protein [Thermoanaerobaculia bacterium]|nr:YdcF family protein [Thermoanaerobaculia bacterium]
MVLRKIVTALLLPTGLVWLAIALAALLAKPRSWGRRLLVLTWLGYTLAASPLISNWLALLIERPYLDVMPLQTEHHYDAVLVLGGGSSITHRGRPQLGASGDRLRVGAALLAAGKTDRLVTSGSSIDGRRDLSLETQVLWTQMGVAPEHIVTLRGPVNTAQEVQQLKRLADDEGWQRIGVVTSGYHMRRTQALCRRYGLEADPLPAHRPAPVVAFHVLNLLPQVAALAQTDMVARELLGLLAVYLFGG